MKKTAGVISIWYIISMLLYMCNVSVTALSPNEITAPSAVTIEEQSGQVLFDKNCHNVRACAFITKVMTLLLVFEAIDSGKLKLDDMITASAHAASMGGSDIWLEEGESMTANDMIKATVVASANDAAVALAETVSGSESAFVEKMNERAKELGMNDTTFKNCNGLDEDGHLTSAYDVALMSRELIKHKEIFNYTSIWMDNLRNGKTQIVNTNKLLKSYNGITGLKTGTTGNAGSCITATATRNGLTVIAVVLGSATGKERFTDAARLLDAAFADYARYEPVQPNDIPLVNVEGGMAESVQGEAKLTNSFVVEKGSDSSVNAICDMKQTVQAPVNIGDVLGSLKYVRDDKVLAEYDIVSKSNIEEMNFSSVFSLIFNYFVNL